MPVLAETPNVPAIARTPVLPTAKPAGTAPSVSSPGNPGHSARVFDRAVRHPFRWADYEPRPGTGLMPLSGTADFGLVGEGEDEYGIDIERLEEMTENERHEKRLEAAPPAGVIAPLPANFAPDVLVNQDLSSSAHNETALAYNPKDPLNIVAGANDYRLGFGSSGFYASLDGGITWRDGILPMPTVYDDTVPANPATAPTLLALDGGGDPAIAFDRAGTVYYADINFHRFGCVSGIFVYRSINKGLTWNRPLHGPGLPGDPRKSGDGIVAVNVNDLDCRHFYDKEWIAVGPRPAAAATVEGSVAEHVTPDRIYVTFTDFQQAEPVGLLSVRSPIMIAYSDDQGRTWSQPKEISGANPDVCDNPPTNECDVDQGSIPVVDPRNGKLSVYFFNGNVSPDQILVVASEDGGETWSDPVRVAMVKDDNLPTGSADHCKAAGGRQLIGQTCFRWSPFGNLTVDPRNGRLYASWSDNTNGTAEATDVDVFVSTSADGTTWSNPVRVNTDKFKNATDQFYPWAHVGPDGTLYVAYLDRSADKNNHDIGETMCTSTDNAKSFKCAPLSTGLWNPDLAFRAGIFIGDYTGVAASPRTGAFAVWPDARRAHAAQPGDNPPPLFSDVAGAYSIGGGTSAMVLAKSYTRSPSTVKGKKVAAKSDLPATGVHRSIQAGLLLVSLALAGAAFVRKGSARA